MSEIWIISCVRKKRDVTAVASELYTSAWFKKASALARMKADRWYILSALHGLIRPTESLNPYEKTLNKMKLGARRAWAKDVIKELVSKIATSDHVTILAGERYAQFIAPALHEEGVKARLPLKGLSIGRQLQWLNTQLSVAPHDVWHSDLDRFYRLLDRLSQFGRGPRSMDSSAAGAGWPSRGVYYFFEPGENRSSPHQNRPRVVRVGTHAVSRGSSATLWTRLRTHRGQGEGGNHRSSIFRLHVGAAMMASSDSVPRIASWGLDQSASPATRAAERAMEEKVSKHIRSMSVQWLDISDAPGPDSDRAYIERNSIALLSKFQHPIDSPSPQWLGRASPRVEIRSSGLWNLNYVSGNYDRRFLDVLADYVEVTIGRLPAPTLSLAPTGWRSSARAPADAAQLALF